ncbi:MAG TPA: sodium-dependent transporter [Pseudomonadales bacterium]
MNTAPRKHVGWASRWTFILAATGSAVGLGNIWKFPYITGEYGGGAFVLVYLLCIAIIGLPVLIAEILLGRQGRSNPVDAMLGIARASDASRLWVIIGIMGAITGLLIMSFYSVVGGWILDYMAEAAKGSFSGQDAGSISAYFKNSLLPDQKLQFAWHSLFALITISVVAAGVVNGIGMAARILMPLLALLMLVLLAYSARYGAFAEAARFLFAADFSKLSGTAVLVAMGHAFFTLSLGMGAIMVYGSYMPDKASIAGTAITIAVLDTVIAMIAGLVIFPLVFAHGISPAAGPGLMFESLPLAFNDMPFSAVFATVFFVLVAIAALSSAISLLEPAVAWMDEHIDIGRPWATGIVGLLVWGGGVACIYVDQLFGWLDFLTTNILLPLGGLLMAIFVGWKMKRKLAKNQLAGLSYHQFNLWYAVLRVFTPIGILLVFAHSIGLL